MKNVIVTLAEILLGVALFAMILTGFGGNPSLKEKASSIFSNIVGEMSSKVIPGAGNPGAGG